MKYTLHQIPVGQGHIQTTFEYCEGRWFHNLTRQTAQEFCHSHSKTPIFMFKQDFVYFYLWSLLLVALWDRTE